MSDTMFIEDKYELVDIDAIEIIEDNREVYDLEVEDDHTYVLANDIISHNSKAKAGNSMLKEMTHFCCKYRVPFVFTNHTYKDVASAPNPMYAKDIQGGGRQATYMASAVIMLRKTIDNDDNKKKVGSIIRMVSGKNRLAKDQQSAEMYLSFSSGPNKYYGLINDAVEAGIFTEINKKNYLINETGEKIRINKLYNNKVFTPERLKVINEYCNKKYQYITSNLGDEEIENDLSDEPQD